MPEGSGADVRIRALLSALLLLLCLPAIGTAANTTGKKSPAVKTPLTEPSPVRGLLAIDTRPDRVTIAWGAPAAGAPITSYQVMWSKDGGNHWADFKIVAKKTFTLMNVETGTIYTFAVSAKNVTGLGYAALVSATADYPTPLPASEKALDPYRGLGMWIDMYSWRKVHVASKKFTASYQPFTCESIDEAASYGVQSLFIQTAMPVGVDQILDPQYLADLIGCAKRNGMYVVAWYYPQLLDVELDFNRALASAKLPGVDGFGLDIESRKVADLATRNTRLVELSHRLHAALPEMALAAITYTPYNLDVAQPNTWPLFPWASLAQDFAVWQPMTYWNTRKDDLAHGAAYTSHTINGLRVHLGLNGRLNIVGAPGNSAVEVKGMMDSMRAAGPGILGGGLYQWSQLNCVGKDAQLDLRAYDGSGSLRPLTPVTPKYTKFCIPKSLPNPIPTTTASTP